MQRIFIIICAFIALISCGRNQNTKASQNIESEAVNHSDFIHVLREPKEDWVQELILRNPLANDKKYISVYFKYDTIVDGYDVRGVYFPSFRWEDRHDSFHGWFYESGIIMYFRNIATGIEYKYTDYVDNCKCFKSLFMSKNVFDINTSDDFKGYKSGDAYIFQYCSGEDKKDADFLFLDIDSDGEDELLLCYYQGGPFRRNIYEIFELADTLLESKGKMIDVYELESIMAKPAPQKGEASYPQISSFTDYTFEDRRVYLDEDSINISLFYHLDIEFPMAMKNKNVLARIQEQLIDTLFHKHYHTTRLDKAISKYWNVNPNMIKRKTTYPKEVPNDSDEYFDYGGVQSRQFEHLCGRTSYNQNGLYIMRHHYTWYGGGCHHDPNTSYIAFDTRTGNLVHFLDIFSEQYDDNEQKMTYDIEFYVSKALLKKYPNISTQYWNDASFTITPKSLVLHYTHYTLGCWGDGEQEVEIPADKAKRFLNAKWKHLFP